MDDYMLGFVLFISAVTTTTPKYDPDLPLCTASNLQILQYQMPQLLFTKFSP